jgi:excinuclease UvrABC ATPase subunit
MGARKEVTESFRKDYHKASRKEKTALLDEFVKRTGYDRKYAVKLLRKRQKEVLLYENGKAVKVKAEKRRRPANRRGRKKYDEAFVIVLRRIWAFFWYKCGRQQSCRRSFRRCSASRCSSSRTGRLSASPLKSGKSSLR